MRSTIGKYPTILSGLVLNSPHGIQLGHKEWGGQTRPLLRPEEDSRGRLQNAVRPERSSGRKAGSKLKKKKFKKQTVNFNPNPQMPSIISRLCWDPQTTGLGSAGALHLVSAGFGNGHGPGKAHV